MLIHAPHVEFAGHEERGVLSTELLLADGQERRARSIGSCLSWNFLSRRILGSIDEIKVALAENHNSFLILRQDLEPGDGFDLCRELRAKPDLERVPILMIVEDGAPELILRAFASGADDCVPESVCLDELSARAGALLRRSRLLVEPCAQYVAREVPDVKSVRRGLAARLTQTEDRLLDEFLRVPGRYLSVASLIERVWSGTFLSQKTVEAHITNLRSKLASTCFSIENRYGVGYRMVSKFDATERRRTNRGRPSRD